MSKSAGVSSCLSLMFKSIQSVSTGLHGGLPTEYSAQLFSVAELPISSKYECKYMGSGPMAMDDVQARCQNRDSWWPGHVC